MKSSCARIFDEEKLNFVNQFVVSKLDGSDESILRCEVLMSNLKVSSLESPGVRRIRCWPYLFQLLWPNQTDSNWQSFYFKLRKLQLRREIQTYLPMLKIKVAFSGEVWSNIFKFLRLTKLPSQTKSKFAYDRLIYLPSFSSWLTTLHTHLDTSYMYILNSQNLSHIDINA